MRPLSLLLGCLLVTACAGPATTPETPLETTTAPTSSTSRPEQIATTTSSTTTTTSLPVSLVETLDDGRPASFLALTTDYEAVEVATETGEVIWSFGSRGNAASLDEEFLPQVVDALWRTSDGRHIFISECCEPAAGRINVMPPDGMLSSEYGENSTYGWAAVPSPLDTRVLVVGYTTSVIQPVEEGDGCDSFVLGSCWVGETFLENDGSGIGAIGWNHDGVRVHWYEPAAASLLTWDSNSGQLFRAPLTWVDAEQALVGLSGQSSGNVVSFLHSYGPDGDITDTEGVVYSPETGGVLASFEVPTGSVLGGYDPSGTYLLYTTADGVVEFQGRGRSGQLGAGYFFASW